MHPSETGYRQGTLEEAMITDLRSFRAIVAILRNKYPNLYGVHISPEAFSKIWDSEVKLDMKYYLERDAYTIELDGVCLANLNGSYLWGQAFLDLLWNKRLRQKP